MLEGKDAEATAYQAYVRRYGASEGLLNEIRKDGNTRFFKIAVDTFYLFDSYGEERGKHTLDWNGGNA
jgi:hypothetical protein